MADPLSVAAAVVGLVVPALHGARLLQTDLDRINDAPKAVTRLNGDVESLHGSLALLKDIDEATWASLGPAILQHASTAIRSCDTACDEIRGDIQRWTKRSKTGTLSWRDRVNVGFFKEKQLQALSGQLQAHKLTFTSVVGIATLCSSIRNTRMTEDLRQKITSQQREIEAASSSVERDVNHAQRALATINLGAEQDAEPHAERSAEVNEDEYEERENAIATLETLTETLQTARELLAELSLKTKDQEISQVADSGGSTNHFGNNYQGIQAGVINGPFTWNNNPSAPTTKPYKSGSSTDH